MLAKKMIVAALGALLAMGVGAAVADIGPGPSPSPGARIGPPAETPVVPHGEPAEKIDAVPTTPTTHHAGAPDAHGEAAGHEAAGHGEAHGAGGHGHHDPTHDFNFTTGVPFGYKDLDIKGGPLGDGKLGVGATATPVPSGEKEEPMSAPFILMLVNFGILLIILAKLGGPVARKTAQDRSDQIKTALEEAAALRAAAQAKLDEYGKKLAAADAEIAAMVEGMRKDAEAEKARVIAAADAQAIAMKKDADERIAAEIDRARASLAREVSRAATSAAEKLVRERATSADHGKLIDAFIADLGAEASRANKEVR
jgi:F-type H+-transporting ATPase subunit b